MSTRDDKIGEIWDYLLESGLASEETLKVVTSINGYNEEALNDVLYAVTGYRSVDQIEDAEDANA